MESAQWHGVGALAEARRTLPLPECMTDTNVTECLHGFVFVGVC